MRYVYRPDVLAVTQPLVSEHYKNKAVVIVLIQRLFTLITVWDFLWDPTVSIGSLRSALKTCLFHSAVGHVAP